jgi:subtilisin family serine protease
MVDGGLRRPRNCGRRSGSGGRIGLGLFLTFAVKQPSPRERNVWALALTALSVLSLTMEKQPTSRSPSRQPWVEALQPRTMLSVTPTMAARLDAAGFERMAWRGEEVYAEPGEWVLSVRGVRGPAAKQVENISAKVKRLGKGLSVLSHLGRDGLVKITAPRGMGGDALRAALRHVRNFEFVEPNAAVWVQAEALSPLPLPDDPMFVQQYPLHNIGNGGLADSDIDAPEAWALSAGAEEVVVGVIDTGVDYRHPDLAQSMWVNPFETPGDGIDNDGNGYIDDIHGADFAYHDGDPMDDNGHGTHVAGVIAAQANNGIGVAGVAPNAKIMALRFLGNDAVGDLSGAVAALNYAADMKERGVNIRMTTNSWGSADFSVALERAIRGSGDAGMLFIAAAGNGGPDGVGDDNDLLPFYPASYNAPNVISATASDSRDALTRLANFGVTSVDLAAPGSLVVSTYAGGTYGSMSGTSLAAPHVAGVAALAFGAYPSATWQSVQRAILAGVDPIAAMDGKLVTGGRLNAAGTLHALAPSAVVGRHAFYNNSAFDGRSAAAGPADDGAIASDKAALLPGRTARFANYTSYSRGINGVMVDVRTPQQMPAAADFAFEVRTATGEWVDAPQASVTVRAGAGIKGSDRVTITWADAAIRDTWLRVTVLGERLGLLGDDVFYFGNAVGESGNSLNDAVVNAVDFSATRASQHSGAAAIDSAYDFNRDRAINSLDLALVRGRQSATPLPLIAAPLSVGARAATFSDTGVVAVVPREALAVQPVAALLAAR